MGLRPTFFNCQAMPLTKLEQRRLMMLLGKGGMADPNPAAQWEDKNDQRPTKSKKRSKAWSDDEYDQPVLPPKRTRQAPKSESSARGRGGRSAGRGRGRGGRSAECSACGH